jgi:hypothetical protein
MGPVESATGATRRVSERSPDPVVISVSLSERHAFSKRPVDGITLLAGLGVEGDAHRGAADGTLVRKSGVTGIVTRGGPVGPGDLWTVTLPPEPHRGLDRV